MSQVACFDRLVMSHNYNKSNLKLDLNDGSSNSRKRSFGDKNRSFLNVNASPAILQSPDLKLLKLGSPELEKLIINTGGFIPTPTPSGLLSIPTQSNGVEDQESFLARGFIEALQRLQEQDGPGTVTTSKGWTVPSVEITNETSNSSSKTDSSSSRWQTDQNRNSVSVITPTRLDRFDTRTPPLPQISSSASINFPAATTGAISTMGLTAVPRNTSSYVTRPQATEINNQNRLTHQAPSYSSGLNLPTQVSSSAMLDATQIKSEDEAIVPSDGMNDDLDLDMNPIDLEVQEHIKHQRKKLRNRLAAQRCRRRKIEREDTLKVKVKELKSKNSELTSLASTLRMQVCDLKQQVMLHVNEGCQVFLKDDEESLSPKSS